MATKKPNPFKIKKDMHEYAGNSTSMDTATMVDNLVEQMKRLPIDHISSVEIPKSIVRSHGGAWQLCQRAVRKLNKQEGYIGYKAKCKDIKDPKGNHLFTRIFRIA